MKLFKQLFGEGATFAKEIFDDSAEFVKGVAQACEPYARDAADRLVQAWEDLTNPDAEDAESTAGSSDKGVDSVNLAAENADSTKEAKPADDAKKADDADSANENESNYDSVQRQKIQEGLRILTSPEVKQKFREQLEAARAGSGSEKTPREQEYGDGFLKFFEGYPKLCRALQDLIKENPDQEKKEGIFDDDWNDDLDMSDYETSSGPTAEEIAQEWADFEAYLAEKNPEFYKTLQDSKQRMLSNSEREAAAKAFDEQLEERKQNFDAFLDRYLVEHPDCQELVDRLRGIERKAETASQSPRVLVDIDIQGLFGLDEEGSEMKPEPESESEPEAEAEIESEPTSEASPSPKKPLRRYRNVTNITTFDDGVRASENARHAEWLRTSTTLRLDKRDLAAITISMDFHLAMEEPASYGSCDFIDHCGSSRQRQVYWMLRKRCDQAGIRYNKDNVPYYAAEFAAAINALRKLLREHGVED